MVEYDRHIVSYAAYCKEYIYIYTWYTFYTDISYTVLAVIPIIAYIVVEGSGTGFVIYRPGWFAWQKLIFRYKEHINIMHPPEVNASVHKSQHHTLKQSKSQNSGLSTAQGKQPFVPFFAGETLLQLLCHAGSFSITGRLLGLWALFLAAVSGQKSWAGCRLVRMHNHL